MRCRSAACGGGTSSDAKALPGATAVTITLTNEGCEPSPAAVPAGPITFTVSGSHTYAKTGTYTVRVSVASIGGSSTTTILSTALIANRIFFAGEHASLTHTWMQGALESALVAVREMLAV